MLKSIIYIVTVVSFLFSQSLDVNKPKYSNLIPEGNKKRFISDENGAFMMRVNVWGHVGSPGSYLVNAEVDIVSLFSVVGGPLSGSNLSKIKLYREFPDSNGISSHLIDMSQFIKNGDRSNFIKIKPNDTIIINQTKPAFILERINTLNSLIVFITFFIQILTLSS